MRLGGNLRSFKLPLIFILTGVLFLSLGIYNSKTPDQPKTSFREAFNQAEQKTHSGKINLNKATKLQLISLPGVGEKTAQKIIQYRPYNSLDKLLEHKIVRRNVFEKIKELIVVP